METLDESGIVPQERPYPTCNPFLVKFFV
jgi:hypothetical protein